MDGRAVHGFRTSNDVSLPPVLVTGTHRSGTTWVGWTLAAAGELGYINEPFKVTHRPGLLPVRIERWFPYLTAESGEALRGPVSRMLAFHYSTSAELWSLRSPIDVGRMLRDTVRFGKYRALGYRPLVKDPLALLAVPWLAAEFNVQVVMLVRHPAAFAGSLKRLGWTHPFADFLAQPDLMNDLLGDYREPITEYARRPPDVIDQAALLWALLNDVISGYRTAHPDWLVVRHEDLSRDPAQGFSNLCAALNLRHEDRVQARVAKWTNTNNPTEAKIGVADALRRDSSANIAT